MITKKKINFLKDSIKKIDKKNRYFIFGSSTRKNNFGDVDLGFYGDDTNLLKIKSFFSESNFPYFVDIINFSKAEKSFIDYVENNEKKIWLN